MQDKKREIFKEELAVTNQETPPLFQNRGDRVAWLRAQFNLSLGKFGKRCGYDGSQVSRIERGQCHASARFIRVICSEFNVRESWLRDGELPVYKDDKSLEQSLPRREGAALSLHAAESQLPQMTWQEALRDLRRCLDLVEMLTPGGRESLAPTLHRLVAVLCHSEQENSGPS